MSDREPGAGGLVTGGHFVASSRPTYMGLWVAPLQRVYLELPERSETIDEVSTKRRGVVKVGMSGPTAGTRRGWSGARLDGAARLKGEADKLLILQRSGQSRAYGSYKAKHYQGSTR